MLVLLPWAIPHVAASYVWKLAVRRPVRHLQLGVVPAARGDLIGYAWFNRSGTAFLVIGLVVVWQSFPFVAIALLAGLQTIPSEVIDAAKVDGADALQQLWRIRLPMLKPLLLCWCHLHHLGLQDL